MREGYCEYYSKTFFIRRSWDKIIFKDELKYEINIFIHNIIRYLKKVFNDQNRDCFVNWDKEIVMVITKGDYDRFAQKSINDETHLKKVNQENVSRRKENGNIINSINKRYFSSSSYKYNNLLLPPSNSYSLISNVLREKSLSLQDKQIKIEKFIKELTKLEIIDFLKKEKIGKGNINYKILRSQLLNLNEDLNYYLDRKLNSSKKRYKESIKGMDSILILSIALGKIISFTLKYKDLYDQPVTKLFEVIGERIVSEYFFNEYKKKLKSENLKQSEFKFYEFKEKINLQTNEDDIKKLGMDIVYFISDRCNFIEIKEIGIRKEMYIRQIIPKEYFNMLLEEFTIIDSEELPMIAPPLPWKINSKGKIVDYGGSFLNNNLRYKYLLTNTHKNTLSRDLALNKDIINMVNNMANTKYIINKKVLDIVLQQEYLLKGGKRLINFRRHEHSNKLSEYKKNKDFSKVNEITQHNSKYLYETSILQIARLFKDVEEIYMTPFIDWRGRVYTSSCVLNIQGGELARSLLLFKNGEKLTNIGLFALKVYTANAYGLNKLSKIDRVKWVDKHLDFIFNIPNNNFWLEADEPLLFLACCLELQGYNESKNYISKLPILLDATCNGLQHLSAIAQDINLGEKVNISPSSIEDSPNDVYSCLIEPIKKEVNKLAKDNKEYYNLSLLNINRQLIKRGIMTITYGVSVYGITKQLISEQFVKVDLKNNHYIYTPIDSSSAKNLRLTYKDIRQLGKIIYESLFKLHDSLKDIMIYFNDMVDLLNQLELPVSWITPSGLNISQKYIKFTKYDISSTFAGKRHKMTLRKPYVCKKGNTIINLNKQKNSFIPNFIHSMDASHVLLLLKKIKTKFKFECITIHDCFGVHANNTELLSALVKESFISIYADKNCINQFHNHVWNNISAVYEVRGNKIYKDKYIYYFPEKPKLGKMNIKNQLKKSNYFIN